MTSSGARLEVINIYQTLMSNSSLHPELDPHGAVFQRMVATGMLTRASTQLNRTLDQALRPLGTTFSRHMVLSAIYHSGPEGVPLRRLADLLFVQPASITGTVDRLVQDGYVERQNRANDRRITLAVITDAGAELYKVSTAQLATCDYGLRGLDAKSLARLNVLLNSVIAAAAQIDAALGSDD